MPARVCSHTTCSCTIETDQDYCSNSCRSAATLPPEKLEGCECGHGDCLGFAGAQGKESLERGAFEDAPEGS